MLAALLLYAAAAVSLNPFGGVVRGLLRPGRAGLNSPRDVQLAPRQHFGAALLCSFLQQPRPRDQERLGVALRGIRCTPNGTNPARVARGQHGPDARSLPSSRFTIEQVTQRALQPCTQTRRALARRWSRRVIPYGLARTAAFSSLWGVCCLCFSSCYLFRLGDRRQSP